jgi:hypothetical protein
MNIYDIKRLTSETSPYFFSRDSLRFFNQTMRSFKVQKQPDGRYRISSPIIDKGGCDMGETVRYFNPINNELETK